MGRPKKEFNEEQFEKLCALQCTEEEIADWFDFSVDTLSRRCLEIYQLTFADIYKKFSGEGKISLRRSQFRMAETNVAMAIWLGKQHLGQKDTPLFTNTNVFSATQNAEQAFLKQSPEKDIDDLCDRLIQRREASALKS